MPEATIAEMRRRLAALAPLEIAIEDESALHAGHAGAAAGGGHYRMTLVSAAFAGQPRVARHRLVYDALADLMHRDIHALAMTLLAPGEVPATSAPPPSHPSGH
ncbi:MAG TPA: BolA family protein [Burkholderiaceae bacterium]|nr:BolA family protein [Burkholderiaceae bacterium]